VSGDTVPPDWPIKRLSNCAAHYLNAFCTLMFIHIVWLTLSPAFMPSARITLAASRTTAKALALGGKAAGALTPESALQSVAIPQ
jgi:hypothetical protein